MSNIFHTAIKTPTMYIRTVLFLLQCLLIGQVSSWINAYDQPFTFQCPVGKTLHHVISTHDNHHEDRMWDFSCQPPPVAGASMTNCEWTNYVNDYDLPLTFQCANNGIIAGISSIHDNHREDRRFKFYCCQVPSYVTSSCYFTPFVNEFDGNMDFSVPTGKVMRGVDSYHDSGKELDLTDLLSQKESPSFSHDVLLFFEGTENRKWA